MNFLNVIRTPYTNITTNDKNIIMFLTAVVNIVESYNNNVGNHDIILLYIYIYYRAAHGGFRGKTDKFTVAVGLSLSVEFMFLRSSIIYTNMIYHAYLKPTLSFRKM